MIRSRSRRIATSILVPIIAVGAATFLISTVPVLRDHGSLFPLLAAVVISVRLSGLSGGFIATLISLGCSAYFFRPPYHSFAIRDPQDIVLLTVYFVMCLAILSLYGSRDKADEQLRASEQRLVLALDSAHMGVWDYNLLTRKFWWSSTLETIYGRTNGDFPRTYGRFFGFIHFDDQPMFNRAITRTIDEGTDYEVDHRIILPDKSSRWVNTRGRVFFNEHSRAERIVGVTVDITSRRKSELQQVAATQDSEESSRMSTVA